MSLEWEKLVYNCIFNHGLVIFDAVSQNCFHRIRDKQQWLSLETHCKVQSTAAEKNNFVNFSAGTLWHTLCFSQNQPTCATICKKDSNSGEQMGSTGTQTISVVLILSIQKNSW